MSKLAQSLQYSQRLLRGRFAVRYPTPAEPTRSIGIPVLPSADNEIMDDTSNDPNCNSSTARDMRLIRNDQNSYERIYRLSRPDVRHDRYGNKDCLDV